MSHIPEAIKFLVTVHSVEVDAPEVSRVVVVGGGGGHFFVVAVVIGMVPFFFFHFLNIFFYTCNCQDEVIVITRQ